MSELEVLKAKKQSKQRILKACDNNLVHYASTVSHMLQEALMNISNDYIGFCKLMDIFCEETRKQMLEFCDKEDNKKLKKITNYKKRAL
jgi:hypothetical protein